MLTTTEAGKRYYERQEAAIEIALQRAVETTNRSDSKGWEKWLVQHDRERVERGDFCVFVKENGYMIIALWAYNKLSKANKKKVDKGGYEYIYIPEA